MQQLPTFEKDANGYFFPGPVVRYFRENMTYTNRKGKVRYWTQNDLARQLGLTRLAVSNMENKNMGLDSIERRRTLATLLNIPLALLGLASLNEQEKSSLHTDATNAASTPAVKIDIEDIQLYKEAAPIFKERYDQGELDPETIEKWITYIHSTVDKVQGDAKNTILAELAKYHLIAANTYARDKYNWINSMQHLNIAKNIANQVNSNELFVMACYYTSDMYLSQHNMQSASKELDSILTLSKSVSSQLRGNILADAALARATISVDEADRVFVRKMLDEAERHISKNFDDTALFSFNDIQYLETRADTLTTMKRYELALECIDEAEDYLPTKKRNREFLKIIRAECYIKQRKPEYDEALTLLSQVLIDNRNIRYYVDYVARLHKIITASSYGNAPDVVNLGMKLRTIGR